MMRRQSGSALVELAIALPVLLLVFFGTVDFARVIYFGIALNNAARAGAQCGAQSLAASQDTVGMDNTVTGASPNISPIGRIILPGQCFCSTDVAVLTPLLSCTTPCPIGEHLSVYVTVTTQGTFSRVTPFPGMPFTVNLTRVARMRR